MLAGEFRPRPRGVSSDRNAPARANVLTKDEELGKRDDDFRPARSRTSILAAVLPWNWRRKRLLLVLLLIGVVYVVVQNIPTTPQSLDEIFDVPYASSDRAQQSERPPPPSPRLPVPKSPSVESKAGPPQERTARADEKAQQYYDGPIKFYRLGATLQSMPMAFGSQSVNRNILFAASSLKSLANLLPMACEMATQGYADAHLVLFGRSTLSIEELLQINGVDNATCTVYFHDARADFAEYSSDVRAETSVAGAMIHIQEYMHPQALIIDDKRLEEQFFLDAIRRKARDIGRPLIEIPSGRHNDFLWITRLDANSISNWYQPTIDIVIQAPPNSAGSLIRLLDSLSSADYRGMRKPRLTVELPANPEPFAVGYLARMQWPPYQDESPDASNLLTVRHRIPSSRVSSEQASLRFLESFYPADPNRHHTLILSPQAQVSPQFMHYLQYTILKYHHAAYGSFGFENVMGFALDVRTTLLNGTSLKTPTLTDRTSFTSQQDQSLSKDTAVPFLYQAPSSGATLIFGDKWLALHSFLEHRLASSHLGKAAKVKKLVSETEPAWMEYLLELMRARGWSVMHPAIDFVTIHNEMAQIPEEYLRFPQNASSDAAANAHPVEEAFLVADTPPALAEHTEQELDHFGPLHQIVGTKGVLPDLFDMPSYSHEGDLLGNVDVEARAEQFTKYFRTTIGGCTSAQASVSRQAVGSNAEDLFCLPGIEVGSPNESMDDLIGTGQDDLFGYAGPERSVVNDDPTDQGQTDPSNAISSVALDETEVDLTNSVP